MLISVREIIEKVLGKDKDANDNDESRAESMADILRRGKADFEAKWRQSPAFTTRLSDLEISKTLGHGKFGRVLLVRFLKQKELYMALKVMNKRVILSRGAVTSVLFEKRILQATDFPFLVRYNQHFKDNANLYLLLEYVAGGDMFTHLRKAYRFDDVSARFYVAQITLSLEYLHHLGIVHRDLKPENVMIGHDGFLKIADFGLAKRIGVGGRTSTKCGTRVYMAPELLTMKRTEYSFGVDWWSLGVMAYEMIVGQIPYEAAHPMELLYKIHHKQIRYPSFMQQNAVKLMEGLLQPKLKYRLVRTRDIKAHPYFGTVDWLLLYHKKVRPPFVPTIRNALDTSNFDVFADEPIEEWSDDIFAKEFEGF